MVKKRKLAAIPPRAKRVVVLDRWGRFRGEYGSVTEAGELSPYDQIIHYQLTNSKAHQGYRYDKVMEFLTESTRGEVSYSGLLTTYLFLDLHWNEMEYGEDEEGVYASWGTRKFYQSGRFINERGASGAQDNEFVPSEETGALENWYTACRVNGLIMYVHIPTIMFLLFHNKEGINPSVQAGYGYSSQGGTFKWKKIASYTADTMALLNNLKYYNLLTEGVPSALWLVPNAKLEGVSFTPRRGAGA